MKFKQEIEHMISTMSLGIHCWEIFFSTACHHIRRRQFS